MLRTRKNYNFKYNAISLEQLLISLLIISLLSITVFKFYSITINSILALITDLSILYKQNVTNFLFRSNIRKSGYKGPASNLLLPEYTSSSYTSQIYPKAPIAACKASVCNTSCLPFVTNKIFQKIINKEIKINTDILLVYDIPIKVEKLLTDMDDYNSPLTINLSSIHEFNVGDNILISDHQYIQRAIISEIINNKLLHNPPFNNNDNLAKRFRKNSEIVKFKHLAFYIAKNKGYIKNVYSLYMDEFSSTASHAIAIVDEVEDLSIKIPNGQDDNQLLDATIFGWLYNERFILIDLTFKNKYKKIYGTTVFTIGAEIKNQR